MMNTPDSTVTGRRPACVLEQVPGTTKTLLAKQRIDTWTISVM